MPKKIKNIFFLVIMSIIVFTSCTERIDIELDNDRIRLVVEGNITDISGRQYIKLSETADYFSNDAPKGVSNAQVIINSDDESITLVESDTISGLYNMPVSFLGVQGKDYDLNIALETEIGGYKDYFATTQMPPLSDDIDSIAVEWMPDFNGWVVRLFAKDPAREDFYMFNGINNGVLLTDSIHKVNISDDRLFNGNYTNGSIVLFFDEEELVPGDIFTLVLSNITKGYASFVSEVQTEIQPNNPIFGGPPANVKSNINNEAAGYFTAFPSAFTSAVVKNKPAE